VEWILQSLAFLGTSKAYSACCPFHKDIRAELLASIKKGVTDR
jgi:DNA primase